MNAKPVPVAAHHVNVTINGRQYRMACEEGQEQQLFDLADDLERRIQELRGRFGEIGDARLIVMAALISTDQLLDANSRIAALQQELDALRSGNTEIADRASFTNRSVVAALNSAAERIEKTTQVLNRTVGGGIAIG